MTGMGHNISATEAARNFSKLLNRVRYGQESFVIVRGGEKVGRLSPVSEGAPKTVGEVLDLIDEMGLPDDDFVCDLEALRSQVSGLPADPWRSS